MWFGKNALLKYEEIRAERNSINTRANIGAALGAFATGFAAGMPRTTTCNRIGTTVQCQTW
jgi:hypothetical protein